MSVLPIGLRADQLRVLVVGAGAVGARKALAFLDAGARVRVVDPRPAHTALDAHMRRLEVLEREFVATDIDDADLVVVATDNSEINAHVVREARARRRLVNSADAVGEATFEMLAAHRAGRLAIAVSTGGVPQAATRIRDAIAERFGERYGDVIEALADIRAQALASGSPGEWGRAADSLLGDDFCRSVEDGTLANRIAEWR